METGAKPLSETIENIYNKGTNYILKENGMKELEILLFLAITAMVILLIILLQKITILKKQADDIVDEVRAYVTYIVEDSETEETQNIHKKEVQSGKEEQQNRLIQAVLGEFFP